MAKPRGRCRSARWSPTGGQRSPRRQPELQRHEIESRDLLGDGVLDLQPRIGLDEVEARLRRVVRVDQKLERAEAFVANLGRHAHRGADQPPARPVVERRTRRHLDELLVASLQRALALPDVSHLPRSVPDDLHFDVMVGIS
jgi:hypothetical protein